MDVSEIKAVIQLYFDAIYENNGGKMEEVFHSAAHIYGHDEDGSLRDIPKETFVKIVASGAPDESIQRLPRLDEVLSIDFTSEYTAIARVKVRVGNILFTDILSFIYLNGKWSVISKLFFGVPIM